MVYCTPITARLVALRLRLPHERLRAVPLNTPTTVRARPSGPQIIACMYCRCCVAGCNCTTAADPAQVSGVRVTFVDANHCPGAAMILFEPAGKAPVLHTGDFRCGRPLCPEAARRNMRLTSSDASV